MARKLIKFEQKSAYYLNKGLEYAEKGDWLKALSLFFSAEEKEEGNTEILFQIARVYSEMGLYEFSNSTLFEILFYDTRNFEAGLMLAKNFSMLGDTFREIYYLGKYSAAGDAEDFVEWLGERIEAPPFELVHPMTQKDRELNKYRVSQLMDRGMTADAKKILEEILEYFPDDIYAKNNLSKAYLIEEKFCEAIRWAQSVLESKPDNVFALCNLGVALYLEGNDLKADEIADKLAHMETADAEDARRLAKFFCFLGRHKDIVHWCKKCLSFTPYEIDFLIFLGIAYYNTGKFEKAKNTFLTLNALRVSPVILKYFFGLIDKATENGGETEILPYDFDIPEKLKQSYFKKLKTLDYSNDRDADTDDIISWALRFADNELVAFILDKLMQSGENYFEENFERMLISELSSKVKSQVLFRLFTTKRRSLVITKDDYFTEVVWPNKLPPQSVVRGFLLACATLNCYMMEMGNLVSKLYNSACELAQRVEGQNFSADSRHDNLFAAVIVRNCDKELCDDKTLCGLFDIDYNVLSFFTGQFYN